MTLGKKETYMDVEYQNSWKHLIDYLKMKDKMYSSDMEEAILVMMDLRCKQDQNVDGRLPAFFIVW